MSDINNEKNVGFPEEENLDIDAIFGSDDGADAALPQIGDADIFASEEPDNANAIPDADAVAATDSETIPVNAEQDSASNAPDAETPESSVKTDADEVPTKENGNAPAKAERQTKDGDKNPKRKNTGKKAAKNAGKTEAAAQDAEGSLFDAFASDEADAPLPPTETETPADDSQPQSLFDKPPVFSYGGVKEPIGDASQTFEELRILKADDFPELGEGKSVSWKVKYGTVTKPVSDPKSATIASVKEEIEQSKSFLDGLAKAKDKNPDCLVIPSVTAKSKGRALAAYKGVFASLEEARKSEGKKGSNSSNGSNVTGEVSPDETVPEVTDAGGTLRYRFAYGAYGEILDIEDGNGASLIDVQLTSNSTTLSFHNKDNLN